MFYATKTHKIADKIEDRQLLAFYTKTHRDGYAKSEGADPISAAEARKLKTYGSSHTISSDAGVFFVSRVL